MKRHQMTITQMRALLLGGSRELWPCYHLDTHLLLIWAMEDVALNHEKSSYYISISKGISVRAGFDVEGFAL